MIIDDGESRGDGRINGWRWGRGGKGAWDEERRCGKFKLEASQNPASTSQLGTWQGE